MKNKTVNDKKRSVSANKLNNNKVRDISTTQNIQQQYFSENPDILKEFQRGSDFINSLIHEYLLKRNYLQTLDTFQEEINQKIKAKQYFSTKFTQNSNQLQLEAYFLSGKKSEFFKLWNRIIPSHLKSKEILLEKLEFFLQIYFGVFPILGDKKNLKEQNFKEMKQRMAAFKEYLESKEVEMSKTTEYLAYYALPYIQNPREHPTYKQIFNAEWIKDLKDKLKDCLVSYLPNGKYPLLYDMFMLCESVSVENKLNAKAKPLYNFLENFCSNFERKEEFYSNQEFIEDKNNFSKNKGKSNNVNNSEIRISDLDYNQLLENYNRLKKKEENTKIMLIDSQKKWTNLSSEILKISFELIARYTQLFPEETKSDQIIETAQKKLSKYDSFLKKNAEELERNQSFNKEKDKSSFIRDNSKEKLHNQQNMNNKSNLNNINSINNNNISQHPSDNDISLYNKTELINNSIHINYDPNFNLEMALIRADLAKVGSVAFNYPEFYDKLNFIIREIRLRISRRKYIKIKQNTLCSVIMHDLFGTRSKHVKIYMNLLNNHKTILETIKLINAITNENKGRTYMLTKPSIIDEIVKIMMSQQGDTEIRQNCLGIIQKFTLRSEPQKRLIDLDVIMWITNLILTESNSLSEYTLEYGLALIMNLSLKSNGREKCEKISVSIYKNIIHRLNSLR